MIAPGLVRQKRFFKGATAALFVFYAAASLYAAAGPQEVPVWPGNAPGQKSGAAAEADTTKPTDDLIAGKRVIRLGNVSRATYTVYPAPSGKNTGAAVVVFPGGGYRILALDLEGTEVCQWLNSIGITGVLVKYRVPPQEGASPYQAPLQDAQRTLGIVRAHAQEWHIDPYRIGVLGFSAGAHLAAALSTNYAARTYSPLDAADRLSCRPDFVVLLYPGYLVGKDNEQVSPELKLTKETPPVFLVQTEDDPVRVENSVFYYMALKKAGIPAEMHLFAAGKHGYGLRRSQYPVTGWPVLAAAWMRASHFLSK